MTRSSFNDRLRVETFYHVEHSCNCKAVNDVIVCASRNLFLDSGRSKSWVNLAIARGNPFFADQSAVRSITSSVRQ